MKENTQDLFQIGVIGLIKAIRNFDFSFNTKFSTYAVYIVSGEIKRYFRDNGIIKVSRGIKSVYLRARAEREKLILQNGYEPSIDEIARNMGESYENVLLAFDACRIPEYLDSYIASSEDEHSKRMEEFVKDRRDPIEEKIDRIALKNAISLLESEERKIILLRYFQNRTQSEVAEMIGVSQVQVSRIEKKIIERLRKHML